MRTKILFLIFLLIASSVSQASLYCGVSSYGTPSQTTRAGAIPYRTMQVDGMEKGIIQIDIQDEYGNGSDNEVTKLELMSSKSLINEIAAGTYSKGLVIEASEDKITLSYKNWLYNCEDPARVNQNRLGFSSNNLQ
jgi:hypothetical protein